MKAQSYKTSDNEPGGMFDYIVVALLLGSLWGFFEVFFKDVLAMGGKPFTSAIMTGIGVSMMALGYGLFRKARIFILISAFTVLTRMIVVPVIGCSPMCRANAVLALLFLGISTTLLFGAASRISGNAGAAGGLLAGAAVSVSGLAFYPAGLAVAPCAYLQNFAAAGGMATFLTREVVWWTLFGTALFYPGYHAGAALRDSVAALRRVSPAPYYAGTVGASALMVAVTVLLLMR